MKIADILLEDISTGVMPVVYLDMDGVLADFDAGYRKRFGKSADLHAKDDPNTGKLVGTDFFATLPKLPEADKLVAAVVKLFGGYSICTSPLRGDHENSGQHKTQWIKDNLSPQPDKIVVTGKKDSYAKGINVLVDDKPKNIDNWNSRGGVGILYNAYTDDLEPVIKRLAAIRKGADSKQEDK